MGLHLRVGHFASPTTNTISTYVYITSVLVLGSSTSLKESCTWQNAIMFLGSIHALIFAFVTGHNGLWRCDTASSTATINGFLLWQLWHSCAAVFVLHIILKYLMETL